MTHVISDVEYKKYKDGPIGGTCFFFSLLGGIGHWVLVLPCCFPVAFMSLIGFLGFRS